MQTILTKGFMLVVLITIVVSGLFAAGDAEETGEGVRAELIVYSNQLGGREEIFAELVEGADFPFDIITVQSGGNEMKDRLIAERNSPLADVVLGGSHVESLALVENDILATYVPAWADDVDEVFVGPDNKYWPWALDTVHFTYNAEFMGPGTDLAAPSDWTDLVDPMYKDTYYFWGSGGTTGGMLVSSMLIRYRDANGELGVSQEGWDLVEGIYANAQNPAPSDWREGLRGESYGGSIWGGGVVQVSRDKGIDLQVMEPPVGTPFFPAVIGVVDTGKELKMEYAKQFVDWWGSAEVQVAWGGATGQAPANVEALREIGGATQELTERLEVQDLDWQFIYENLDTWREKIALEFGQ